GPLPQSRGASYALCGMGGGRAGRGPPFVGLKKLDTQCGEEVPAFYQGYGRSYSIGNNYIRWTITSLKRRTEVLKHYLAEVATEVRDMREAASKADADASRYRR
ncbi:hypothetical protein H0H87_002711, partial [Tephrocybe sp. NHM501043]